MEEKRKSIPKDIQLRVWKRDNWTCKYCGEPVFFAPTLKLLDELSPGHGLYHPHGKADEILTLFQWRWASVDHMEPWSKGGEDLEDNYVTACWECNLKFREKTWREDKPKPTKFNKNTKDVNWDGLSSLYIKLNPTEDHWVKLLKSCGDCGGSKIYREPLKSSFSL